MDRLKIPTTLALLGLSFTACGDDEPSIVGTWEMTMANGETFPQMFSEDGYSGTVRVFLKIDADLTGTYSYDVDYDAGGEDYSEATALSVDDTDAPIYVLSVAGDGDVLSCELDGSTLNCTDLVDDGKSTFKRR